MQNSWKVCAFALIALLAIVDASSAFGEEPVYPGEPLEARIKPPTGVAAQARIKPPTGYPTPDDPTSDARILPPSGVAGQEPSFFDLLLEWLRAQARIGVPIG